MDLERAIKIIETGSKFPDVPHTADEVDEACKIVCDDCKEAVFVIENLISERDAAIEMLHGECHACKNNAGWHNIGKCATCKHENASGMSPFDRKIHRHDNWEWKGIKESGEPDAEK